MKKLGIDILMLLMFAAMFSFLIWAFTDKFNSKTLCVSYILAIFYDVLLDIKYKLNHPEK